MGENGVKSEESVNGGIDVLSYTEDSADHLVVMVHGILGSTTDWQYGANQFVKMLPDKVIVHCSERNTYGLTLDGIDVMGERLAEEVIEVINRRPGLRKISFISHSLGGLVSRFAIGQLYRPSKGELLGDPLDSANSRGTICGLEAMNYITLATPHLGSRGNRHDIAMRKEIGAGHEQHDLYLLDSSNSVLRLVRLLILDCGIDVPLLFGVTAMEKVAAYVSPWIFRRTGRHLFLTDTDEGEPPLLQRMVYDHGNLYFMSALRAFKRRVAYANVGYDHIVGWRTSSIRHNSELPKWEDSLNEKYPHIVYEDYSEGVDVDKCEQTSDASGEPDIIEEELVTALSRLSWEKVSVSFHSSRQRFAAHSVIQVKYPFLHSEGADVIQHVIDHFVV